MQGVGDDGVGSTRKDGKDHRWVFDQPSSASMSWPMTFKVFTHGSNPDDRLVYETYGIHSSLGAGSRSVALLRHMGIGSLC